MLQRPNNDAVSPRELQNQTHEREMAEIYLRGELTKKELDVELAELEAKWSSWLRIPISIVLLPVKVGLVLPLIFAFAFGRQIPKELWDILKR